MKVKQYIILFTVLLVVGVVLSHVTVLRPHADENAASAVRAYASSTHYMLIEEEALLVGEEGQAAWVKADQPVIEKYKYLFDE
jgi:hypothetical protein